MTVVQFKRTTRQTDQEPPKGEHRFTVYIYEVDGEDGFDAVIQQPDVDDVDLEKFIDAIRTVENAATLDRFKATGDPHHDWLMTARIYRSSLVETKALIEEFETQAQQEWLRRRLEDAWLNVADSRRGLAYHLHDLLNRIDRAIARIRRQK